MLYINVQTRRGKNELKDAYDEYKELEDYNAYLAIKNYVWQLRKHWYASLIEKISE